MFKILAKYPTRSRPDLFLKTLSEYINLANDNSTIQYLISYDADDVTMSLDVIEKAIALHPNVVMVEGEGVNKIEACNRDIEKAEEWDICLLISDDMEIKADGWDDKLRQDMNRFYPDTDGCLWYFDGSQSEICTLSCVGKKYYDRFEYLYHPSYKSFYCDNEFTEVAQSTNQIKFISQTIIKHQHPAWGGGVKEDALYRRNDIYWNNDSNNYQKRKANGFNR